MKQAVLQRDRSRGRNLPGVRRAPGQGGRRTRRNVPTSGKPAAPSRRPWRARRPTSWARISPCRAAPSPKPSARLKDISAKYGLPIVIFGHAGDGNLHPNILFDKRDPEQWEKVEQMVAEEFALALRTRRHALGRAWCWGARSVPIWKKPSVRVSLEIQKADQSRRWTRSIFSILEKFFPINPIMIHKRSNKMSDKIVPQRISPHQPARPVLRRQRGRADEEGSLGGQR